MQNLKSVDHRTLTSNNPRRNFAAAAWDLSNDSIIYATGPAKEDALLTLKRIPQDVYNLDEATTIAAWDALSPHPDLEVDRIIDIRCFSDTQTIVIVLEGGDIVVVRESPEADESLIEIVGSVDAGIAAVRWSPDEELLVIATKADTVLFMTRSFQGIADIALVSEDLKVSNHVSVGWGKAETQFRGRGAKALRDPTIPEHVDAGTLSELDDGRTCISWRGDGQYVAINSVLQSTPARRVIRVYSREGALDSVSEAVDGLEAAVSWKPSGQIIASTQRRDNRVDVVFFERNGLRHGEFSLRLSPEDLKTNTSTDLQWNADSSILAVVLAGRVQFWTSSNYRWYCKQVIRSGATSAAASQLVWHPEKPLQSCYVSLASLHTTSYVFEYETGSVNGPHDFGLVLAIDGKQLDVSPMAIANIPPPMSYDQVILRHTITDAAVSPDGKMLAALHSDSVSIIKCDYERKPVELASVILTFALGGSHFTKLTSRQITIDADLNITVLSGGRDVPTCLIRTYTKDGTPLRTIEEGSHQEQRKGRVSALFSSPAAYAFNGRIRKLEQQDAIEHSLLPSCTIYGLWQSESEVITFGLTSSGSLHIKSALQDLKIPGCTSFLTTSSYLVFTTSQHLLKFVHLHDGLLEIPADEPETDERCRSIERGAKMVTIMPSTFAVVLQMPRGNLETIYPRALVLAGIRSSLQHKDYKKTFLVCRNHRVDMNILYDYLPAQLLQDVDLFLKQVRKKEHVDLFLSSLSEEDTSQTIYKETLHDTKADYPAKTAAASKVNLVCDTFLVALAKRMPSTLQNVITAHVCKTPPDLAAALRLIADLRNNSSEGELENAVEHICFLGDVNQLYDTSLGLYELEVTLLVAQQSQKDPREYLPYLQGLQKTEARRQHFIIDNDLKRYAKAITHLHALDAFDELVTYMERHHLYSTAIELYRHDKQRLSGLMRSYADYLTSVNRYDDAAILYEYVHDYSAANEAYRSAGMWRESLSTAAMVPLSASEIAQLAESIAEAQEESKDFASAAIVRLDYLQDLPSAVKLHCRAYSFAEATRLAILRQKPELLSDVIDPSLVECSASMTELLAEMQGQINAQVPRLRELRLKKVEEPMAYLNAGEGEDADVPDNLSVAPTDASTSGGTFMTRYTNRSTGTLATNATRKTSKNRRREERKRAKGKKGTVYEEEYLVNSITRLIERLNTTSEDITRLVQGLMRRAMRERAIAVENAMVDVWETCKAHVEEVYEISQVKEVPSDQNDLEYGQRRPERGQGVLWDSLNGMQSKLVAPELKPFSRSGSLTS